jgi:hypothetical protein
MGRIKQVGRGRIQVNKWPDRYILHDAIVKRRKVKPVSLEDDKKDDET